MTKTKNVNGAEPSATSTTVKSTTSIDEALTGTSSQTQETSSPSAPAATVEQQMIQRLNKNCNTIFSRITEIQRNMTQMMGPKTMAQLRSECGGYYGYLMGEMAELDVLKAEQWQAIREDSSSAVEADRKWDATELGKWRTRIKARKDMLENMSSSLRTALEVAMNEASGRV